MKQDIIENGRTEMFSQSPNAKPYERERPVTRQYAQMIKNYQNALKLLDDKLPKEIKTENIDDGFDEFIKMK